jgi:hypothetical protein
MTKLITVGCSATFGLEMPDILNNRAIPSIHSWPAELGKYLGLETINLAIPGTGIDFAVRSIVREIPKHINPIVGISIGARNRFEYIQKIRGPWPWTWTRGLAMRSHGFGSWRPCGAWIEDLPEYFALMHTDLHDWYRTLSNIVYMQLFLEQRNLRYFFVTVAQSHLLIDVPDEFMYLKNLIDESKHFKIPFRTWCDDNRYTAGPAGHINDPAAYKDYVQTELGPWVDRLT